MKDPLLQKIADWADRMQVLLPGTAVVAGISGGADSVCLLHALLGLAGLRSFSVFAVHINHLLRGSEADEDESFVRGLCEQWQVPLRVFREDVAALAKRKGCTVEEAGRMVRYERFRQVMSEEGAQYIAVAHHREDQAETVFFHLLRGSGLEGLCGMEGVSREILRPLLETSRDEITAYLDRNSLAYRMDSSNLDNSYARNAIRNQLFPLIQERTGFPVAAALTRASRLLKADRDFLQQMAAAAYDQLLVFRDDKTAALQRGRLSELHPAISARCIRMAWEAVTGSTAGLEEKHVAAVLQLARKKQSGPAIQLPKGVCASLEYESLVFARQGSRTESAPYQVPLEVPGLTRLPEKGMLLYTTLQSRAEYEKAFGGVKKPTETSLHQIFDYEKINRGINIRNRHNGDIFYPYRSPGSKKLKEFLIDEKIPRHQRENIPLLAVDNHIIWVLGLRTSEAYQVDGTTERILSVRVEGINHQGEAGNACEPGDEAAGPK